MSDVTISVGGRSYTVGCAEGQEDHIRSLADTIDAKLGQLGGKQSSLEAKNILFAALILADELEEAKRSSAPAGLPGNALAAGLEAIAERLENTASVLEGSAQSS